MRSALRLRRSADFVHLRRYGRVYRGAGLLLSAGAGALSHNRYGIIVGGRLGKAVARNRFKRRLRAILLELHPELRQGYDIAIIARRGALQRTFHDLKRIVRGLCRRAGLIGG